MATKKRFQNDRYAWWAVIPLPTTTHTSILPATASTRRPWPSQSQHAGAGGTWARMGRPHCRSSRNAAHSHPANPQRQSRVRWCPEPCVQRIGGRGRSYRMVRRWRRVGRWRRVRGGRLSRSWCIRIVCGTIWCLGRRLFGRLAQVVRARTIVSTHLKLFAIRLALLRFRRRHTSGSRHRCRHALSGTPVRRGCSGMDHVSIETTGPAALPVVSGAASATALYGTAPRVPERRSRTGQGQIFAQEPLQVESSF